MIRRILRRFLDSSLRTKYLAAILLLVGAMFLGSSYLISRNLQSASDTLFRDAQSDMTDIYREINRFEKRMVHLSTIMQNSEVALDLLSSIQDLDLQSFEPIRQKIKPILFPCLTVPETMTAGCTFPPPTISWIPRTGSCFCRIRRKSPGSKTS